MDTVEKEGFGSPWEELKRRLNDELTPEDLKNVRIIVSLGQYSHPVSILHPVTFAHVL